MERLASELAENLEAFRALFHAPENCDFVVRELAPHGVRMAALYIDGMANRRNLEDMVLRPLMNMRPFGGMAPEGRSAALAAQVLPTGTGKLESGVRKIAAFVLDGNCAVLCDGCAQAVLAEMPGFASRAVDQPPIESAAFAPHEAFNETIRTNLTLLHRILRTPDFVTEILEIGDRSKTKVAVTYLSGVANPAVVREVKRRLQGVEVDRLLSIGQLQQLIEDRPFGLLPQIMQTERPDRVASFLTDGMVAIACDGAPYMLAAPATFWHFLHTPDDHALRWQYGTFMRLVRVLGFFLSLLLPAVYNSLLLYHQELLPTDMLGYMGSTLGIVGGLVLGQAAVSANLISPLIIFVVSVAGLGLFAVPSYPLSLAVRIARLVLVLASTLAGFVGMVVALLCILCAGAAMDSFGTPYFAPVTPHMRHNPDLFLRLPDFWQTRRPGMARPVAEGEAPNPRKWDRGGQGHE